jgi:co-chaperonin GroES (HSP10)
MTRFRPTKGIVFIKPEDSTHPEACRIIVPGTAQNRDMPNIGRVVAMGGAFITKKGVVVQPEFSIGDRVFFKKFTGLWTDVRGKKWIMVKMAEVEGVFT